MHSKCPAQHSAHLLLLQNQPHLQAVFCTSDGSSKSIECIHLDGISDKGPSHEEVQYWWTEWHVMQAKVVTLVTTRSNGFSYLNRVELQNDSLARPHSNLFIPSTLHGSPINMETGKIDDTILHKNLSTTIDVYIERCNGGPCNRTEINLYRGAQFNKKKERNS